MKLIKHNDPKYGFFVGYSDGTKGLPAGNPVFQPDKYKARIKFRDYLTARPHTDPEKELERLSKIERLKNKLTIILTW